MGAVKEVMVTMVVNRLARSAVEEIENMRRLPKETNLAFLTRVMFSFRTTERKHSDEKDSVMVFFGKLSPFVQDKVMGSLETSTINFGDLVELFEHMERQLEYEEFAS